MKLSIIFSTLFSVIAAQTPLATETFTFTGTFASTTAYQTATHGVWSTTKAAVASSAAETLSNAEKQKLRTEIVRLVVPSGTVFKSVTPITTTTALTQITISKMALKDGSTAAAASSLSVTFSCTIKAGVNDITTTVATLKTAFTHVATTHTTLFTNVAVKASAKTTFKVSALYTTTDKWVADYSNLASSASIIYINTQMTNIINLINPKIKADCADAVTLVAKDIHVNSLVHKAASTGRKRRSTAVGTVNAKFTASVKAPTGSTTTTSKKLIAAVDKATGISGAAKSSAERMITSVTMTLFALGFYMF